MIAFTWPALTKTGMALTVVCPCVTLIETPPSVLLKGKVRVGVEDGPIARP